jgi:diguanylate cyclase (GGDEF)-like protein
LPLQPRRLNSIKADLRRRFFAQRGVAGCMTGTTGQDQPGDGAGGVEALRAELSTLRAEVVRLTARLAEAEGLADRDALTPLLNRRAFVRELARSRALAARYGTPASLVYFDLDGLKAINDRFGHAAGDEALKAVAAMLADQVRASDVVGRIGGDEFAVILAQTDGFQAEAKAAALAQSVADPPPASLEPGVRLSVSWGVAEVRGDLAPEAVIAEADAAMYSARRAARG